VKQTVERTLPLSRLDNPNEDDGLAGARLGIQDSAASGRFLKQEFSLKDVVVANEEEAVKAAAALHAEGHKFILVEAPAATILKIADALKDKDAIVFNISSYDVELREENCRANLMHTPPDRYMLADALAQYSVWKKWTRWHLVHGALPEDKAMADAIRRAAKRFGVKIVGEKEYKEEGGARRTDSGHEQVQLQMPVFTQDAPEHDLMIVADENEVFGPYVNYRTWTPRPVAGTSGLTPSSWHSAHEQWGATQFQNRFQKLAKRVVRPIDYHAWLAVRIVAEAAAKQRTDDVAKLDAYIKSPELSIAAFKGLSLNFRPWNNQLRQPIVLGDRHLPVTWSPQQGFEHQFTRLDTLGVDGPESKCKL
jgi:ABC transporter substrate binding protein (PQQ-dependent alcohol dehydrogenase system)